MERPNLSSSIGKIEDKWKYFSEFTASSDNNIVPCEGSFVARNVYACSFCKRRFKSAQALGGHMNVHRRERARLRLLPLSISADHSCSSLHNPNPNPNPSPNPNPNFASSLSSPTTCCSYAPRSSVNSPSDLPPVDHKGKKKLIVFDFDHITVGLSSNQGRDKNTATNYSNSMRSTRGVEDGPVLMKGFSIKDDKHNFKALKNENNIIRLDLEMSLLKDSKPQDVDLELRLGYF